MNKNRQLIITSKFIDSLEKIILYIKNDSYQNALNFKNDLEKIFPKIIQFPEANPLVKQMPTKKNWYRFRIFKKKYKLIFKVLKEKIILIDIIHTSQDSSKISKLRTKDYA